MESVSQIAEWIDFAKLRFALKVASLTWPKNLGLDLHDVRFSLLFNGREFEGRGTHKNLNGAFARAQSELVERITLFTAGLTSSTGIACHTSQKLAEQSAVEELHEREFARLSYLAQTPVVTVDPSDLNPSTNGLVLHRFVVAKTDAGYCAITVAEGRKCSPQPFEIAVGHGFSSNIHQASRHADIESLRTAAWLMFGEIKPGAKAGPIPGGEFWTELAKDVLGADRAEADKVLSNLLSRTAKNLSHAPARPTAVHPLTIPEELGVNDRYVVRAEYV